MADDRGADDEFVARKKKPSKEDERRKNIAPGSLMKAIIRPGGGSGNPKEGDQVIFHCTIRTLDGVIVESTRSEHGGNGKPVKLVMGKSKMILGFLEGIPTMLKGEVAMLKMKPEMHYGEPDCPVAVSDNFPKHDELHFEIELINFFNVKVIAEDFGVIKQVLNEGQGWESPREPYEVKAWITAKASNGDVLIAYGAGEPFHFTFGKDQVPRGLEMGIGTMTRGEKAIIYVDEPYLTHSAFMSFGSLQEAQFEVELLQIIQVRDMLGDGRLIKRRIKDGKGEFPMDCPLHDSLLRIHYKGMLLNEEKTVFYDTRIDNDGHPLEFCSGEGLVPEGLEMSVRLMLPGEVALVTCPPDYAYDKFKRPDSVPEGADVQWEVELLEYEKPKDWTGLDFSSIMEEAEKIKSTGNRLFKEGKFELSKAKYEQVLREFNHVNPQDDEEGKTFLSFRNSLHLNVAACYHKIGEYRKSIEACNKVLDTNPNHAKALYRRGTAYMMAGDFDEARQDFEMMIKVDKSSEPDATAALLKLRQKEKEVDMVAKKQFRGLFDKKPGIIAEVPSDSTEDSDNNNNNNNNNIEGTTNEDKTIDSGKEEVDLKGDVNPAGWFATYWPFGRNFLRSLGLGSKCSIL